MVVFPAVAKQPNQPIQLNRARSARRSFFPLFIAQFVHGKANALRCMPRTLSWNSIAFFVELICLFHIKNISLRLCAPSLLLLHMIIMIMIVLHTKTHWHTSQYSPYERVVVEILVSSVEIAFNCMPIPRDERSQLDRSCCGSGALPPNSIEPMAKSLRQIVRRVEIYSWQ